MKAVVDTNVIVSALMNVNGPPAKVLSLILNGNIKMLYDNRILFEYIEVLSRKEFGFNIEIINDMVDFLKRDGEFINADYQKARFIDETDKKFFEVYKYGKAQYLITGNIRHFPEDKTIILPKEFLEEYDKGPQPPSHHAQKPLF